MTGPSVSLSNVGLKYADNIILQNISAEFESAKCHVIMGGPNGGGKTSLLRSILGLTPFSGNIELNWPEPSAASGKIGYVPQKAMFEASSR